MSGALVLFTRDLRVTDHPALDAAVREHDVVVPAFILDEQLIGGGAGTPNRLSFLLECLEDLRGSLEQRGSTLIVRRGEFCACALAIVREHGLSAVHMSADHGPYAVRRRRELAGACREHGAALKTFPGITAVEPGELTPAGADHYRVFTPYWRAWSALEPRVVVDPPSRVPTPPVKEPGAIPELRALCRAAPSPELMPGGESAALGVLEHWLAAGVEGYGSGRDELSRERTSRISAHLHFGCLSAAAVLERLPGGDGAQSFARQLCWRDFHHQVLAARPDITHNDYRPRGDRWNDDPGAVEQWQQGLTGYPIVDAGMRQLAREGHMHNRARMIVASFLTKLLRVDWRVGAAHFASLLCDADVACNTSNWQWVAGTGNDTRPNRVLNPLRQALRLDPDGDYVRRHVPELRGLAGAAVHEPWKLPGAQRPAAYPQPIIDHQAAAAHLRSMRAPAS